MRRLRAAEVVRASWSRRCLSSDAFPAAKLQQHHLQQQQPNPPGSTLKEAERVVGYSTSFLNLRWLLNDEIANTALYMKKLTGTEHPLLKIAKDVLFKSNAPSWGLIVLLISKAGGFKKQFHILDQDITAGILHSQRVLAEVTEMVRTSYLIHCGVIAVNSYADDVDILNYGNKIALLSGDYLLSKSFSDLSNLRNQAVQGIISSSIRDFSECVFLSCGDYEFPIPHKPTQSKMSDYCTKFTSNCVDYGPYKVDELLGHPKLEWVLRNVLASGNLLGKACLSALLIAGHEKMLQERAYLFGRHLSLAWQANLDLQNFNEGKVDYVGAPVMLALDAEPHLYPEFIEAMKSNNNQRISSLISETDALENTRHLQAEFAKRALDDLRAFDENPATISLRQLVNVI